MSELLPCPFCGGAVQPRHALWPSDGDTDSIMHAGPSECGLPEFSTHTADGGLSVAAAWNRRASLAALTPEIRAEALEESARVVEGFTCGRRALAAHSVAAAIRALSTVAPEGRE